MGVGNTKFEAFKSVIGGQDALARRCVKETPKSTDADRFVSADSYQTGSKGKSLEALEKGGKVAGSAQFKAPRRTLFG